MEKLSRYNEFINEQQKWSKNSMKESLGNWREISFAKDFLRIKGLLWLLERTEREPRIEGIGFNLYDQEGKIMKYARELRDNHYLEPDKMKYIRIKIPYYANQLAWLTNNSNIPSSVLKTAEYWKNKNWVFYPENKVQLENQPIQGKLL